MIGGYIGLPIGGVIDAGEDVEIGFRLFTEATTLRPATITFHVSAAVIAGQSRFSSAAISSFIGAHHVSDDGRIGAAAIHFTLSARAISGADALRADVVTVFMHAVTLTNGETVGSNIVTSFLHPTTIEEVDDSGANVVTSFVHPRVFADPESVGHENVGDDVLTLYITPAVHSEVDQKGSAAVAHTLVARALADPETFETNNPGRTDGLVVYYRFDGHDGTRRKRKHGKVALIDRKITVKDGDGRTRTVSLLDRFKPPPPFEYPPDWVVQAETDPIVPAIEPVEIAPLAPSREPLSPLGGHELENLRDEADLIAIVMGMPDPVLQDAIRILDEYQDIQDINRLLEMID